MSLTSDNTSLHSQHLSLDFQALMCSRSTGTLKAKDFLKIKQCGKIEIIEDHQQCIPIYKASATSAFPYLYLHGEKSPLDYRDYKLSRYRT